MKQQARLDEAEKQYWAALYLCHSVPATASGYEAQIARGLGDVYFEKGDFEQSERFYMLALDQTKQLCGSHREWLVEDLNNLGLVYHAQDRIEQEKLVRARILALLEDNVSLDAAWAAESLADIYRSQGRFPEAASLYKKALTRCKDACKRGDRPWCFLTSEPRRRVWKQQPSLEQLTEKLAGLPIKTALPLK